MVPAFVNGAMGAAMAGLRGTDLTDETLNERGRLPHS